MIRGDSFFDDFEVSCNRDIIQKAKAVYSQNGERRVVKTSIEFDNSIGRVELDENDTTRFTYFPEPSKNIIQRKVIVYTTENESYIASLSSFELQEE